MPDRGGEPTEPVVLISRPNDLSCLTLREVKINVAEAETPIDCNAQEQRAGDKSDAYTDSGRGRGAEINVPVVAEAPRLAEKAG